MKYISFVEYKSLLWGKSLEGYNNQKLSTSVWKNVLWFAAEFSITQWQGKKLFWLVSLLLVGTPSWPLSRQGADHHFDGREPWRFQCRCYPLSWLQIGYNERNLWYNKEREYLPWRQASLSAGFQCELRPNNLPLQVTHNQDTSRDKEQGSVLCDASLLTVYIHP